MQLSQLYPHRLMATSHQVGKTAMVVEHAARLIAAKPSAKVVFLTTTVALAPQQAGEGASTNPCMSRSAQEARDQTLFEQTYTKAVVQVVVVPLWTDGGVSGIWWVVVLPVDIHKARRKINTPPHRSLASKLT